jgi:hypothetical protein
MTRMKEDERGAAEWAKRRSVRRSGFALIIWMLRKPGQREGNAVERFIARHAQSVIGRLSGFDRLVFRGTLRLLAHRAGMMSYLWAARVLLKDFGAHAQALSGRLKAASVAAAEASGRPVRYLASSASDKEALARSIAQADGIETGLICILTAVETCWSYEIVRERAARELTLQPRLRKCLHLYHYQIHPTFGFMHARIQTWFPFSVQVCLNGRAWLARAMDAAGLGYVQRDNCFVWLEDPARAQALMDRQVQAAWPRVLDEIAHTLNPIQAAMFAAFPVDYYWSTYQSEWASDILFRDPAALARLYPGLVHHGLTTFASPEVMRFLGRRLPASGRLPARLQAEVVSDLKTRPEGMRLKHRLGDNSLKMYDKQGSVLRVETTINDPADFKAFRTPEGKPKAPKRWLRMRRGIADLHRRSEVSQAANDRYLDALAAAADTTSLGDLAARLCRPVRHNGRRVRALNPLAADDAALLAAISRGEFALRGFRNRDLRALLFDDARQPRADQRRHATAVSRKLALLRAHGLIRKVPKTHRYHLTKAGRTALTAILTARNTTTDLLTKLAA